jgi:hypothetical protein
MNISSMIGVRSVLSRGEQTGDKYRAGASDEEQSQT